MWKCPNCSEWIDKSFAICWQCGTDETGKTDPAFYHADLAPVIYQDFPKHAKPKRKCTRASVAVSAISIGVIVGVIAIGGGFLYAFVLSVIAVPAAIAYVFLQFYGLLYSALFSRIGRWQKQSEI